MKVVVKANEIVADAMGCCLDKDVKQFTAEQSANGFGHTTISRGQSVDVDQGQIETGDVTVTLDVAWLHEGHAGLN